MKSPSPKQVILFSQSNSSPCTPPHPTVTPIRQSIDSVGSGDSASQPPISNTQPPISNSQTNFVKIEQPEVDSSTQVCIANANGTSLCRGEVHNLNKLTSYLDLITRQIVMDDGTSAMERAIIKSRLKIPFWSADNEVILIESK